MARASRSEPGLDLYRGFVVVAMFCVHARRLQAWGTRSEGVGNAIFDFMLWAEPYIAASFLYLVGFSLVLSQAARDRRAFFKRLCFRGAQLYVLSGLLFLPQFGLEWPDLVFSSGILSVIAVAIVVVGLMLELGRSPSPPARAEPPQRRFLPLLSLATAKAEPRQSKPGVEHGRRSFVQLASLGTLGVLIVALLDSSGAVVSGLNAGPGGNVPLISFAALGAIAAIMYQRFQQSGLLGLAAGVLPGLLLAWLGGDGWTAIHDSSHHDYGGLAAAYWLEHPFELPQAARTLSFWNHTALGALGLAPLLVLSSEAFVLLQHRRWYRSAPWLLWPLEILGRRALWAYVAHLILLGLVSVAGFSPHSALETALLVLALVVLCCLLAWARDHEYWKRRPATQT